MRIKRVYLVEFMLWRRRRGTGLRRWREGAQLDLPGLPDYQTPFERRPEIMAHCHPLNEPSDAPTTWRPALRKFVLFAPLIGLPVTVLDGVYPSIWLWWVILGTAWVIFDHYVHV